jgi:demethylmenaquinone methyltransferase/2-methoxy-6-polyprenyl-1,4-benzoquinol methylase
VTQDYYSYIQPFFDRWARLYDIVVAPLAGVRKKVVALTAAPEGARVLDVCTGTGKQAFAFAKKGYSVTGIDFSKSMLKIASRHNKYPNLKLDFGDSARLPYPDAAFDVSCVAFGLHEMPPEIRQKTVREMMRVTRPGGAVVVMDYALPRHKIGRFFIFNFIRLYETKYYPEFVHADIPAFLKQQGVSLEAEQPVMLRAGKIYKGKKP